MRIMGFSLKWPKMTQNVFTTFRLRRRDKDWQVGDLVQVVYKPRSENREPLGTAEIIRKELRRLSGSSVHGVQSITVYEAIEDGFSSYSEMETWLLKAHGRRVLVEPINKLTLRWINGETTT